MFEKFYEILRFDSKLFEIQKKQIFILVFAIILFKFLLEIKGSSKFNKEDLKINVNTADFEELQKVPYIGEKTALKIIKLRNNYGYIEDVKQLKNIRNFKRFKYYIKTK